MIGKNIVKKLVDTKEGVFFRNDKMEATVLFAGIKSFSAISEKMNPEKLISTLRWFYATAQEIIFKHNGTFSNIFGNELMAVFGLISSDDIAPHNAINAALDMHNAASAIMESKGNKDDEAMAIGIGIDTGDIVSGNIGFNNKIEHAVVGDSVHIAKKLQQISKGGEIIIGEKTFSYSQDQYKTQKIGKMKSENSEDQVMCYKIVN